MATNDAPVGRRLLQQFDVATQCAHRFDTKALEDASLALEDLIRANVDKTDVPDSRWSSWEQYTAYVYLQDDLSRAREKLIATLGVLSVRVGKAGLDGRINASLDTKLLKWLHDKRSEEQGNLNDTRRVTRQLTTDMVPDQVQRPRTVATRHGPRPVSRNIAGADDLTADWTKAKLLGSGTYGEAILHLRQNAAGVVTDRIVIKESGISPDIKNSWTEDGEPLEVASMQRLNESYGSEYVVKLRGWAIAENKMKCKLYLEFCPHGDLWNVIQKYHFANGSQNGFIPEPFAWAVLEGLARSGLIMEQGDTRGPVEGWVPIVHRDLKPNNLFMTAPDPAAPVFRNSPMAKLGDFGLAVFPEDPRSEYDFKCRLGYMPPELCNAQMLRPGQLGTDVIPGSPETDISSLSTVFGVGYILWAMLVGRLVDERYASAQNLFGQFAKEISFQKIIDVDRYSFPLRELIYWCMEFQPNDRPSFRTILHYIEVHTATKTTRDRSAGARHAPPSADNALRFSVRLPQDEFGVGVKLRDVTLMGNAKAPAPPPIIRRGRDDPDTPDDVLFGSPGRTYDKAAVVKKVAVKKVAVKKAPIKRRAIGADPFVEGEGPALSKRASVRPVSASVSAGGGASPPASNVEASQDEE